MKKKLINYRRLILNKKYLSLMFILMLYSLLILIYSCYIGVWYGDEYKGYSQTPNWFLFILFWIPIVLLVKVTWYEFEESWYSLFKNNTIQIKDNISQQFNNYLWSSNCQKLNLKEYYFQFRILKRFSYKIKFIDYLKKQKNNYLNRKYIFIYALLLTTVVMGLDLKKTYDLYQYETNKEVILTISKINNTTVYLLGKEDKNLTTILFKDKDNNISIDNATWVEAWLFKENYKIKNKIFVIVAYIQQYILILLGFIALLQIWVHLYYFANFNNLLISKQLNMKLELDFKSNIHEFGLERWNQALNNIYWVLVPSLIIPIISKKSQSEADFNDIGQILLKWIVPLLFLSPMIFTIIARQSKVVNIWDKVRVETDNNIEKFHQQVLWPLDKNWASKLGIVLAFGLLSYLIGDIFSSFIS